MKREQLEAQKKAMIQDYFNSGMTADQWCMENNQKRSNLRYWITKGNRQKANHPIQTGFVQFAPLIQEATPVTVCVGGVHLELKSGFDVNVFRDVIYILKAL